MTPDTTPTTPPSATDALQQAWLEAVELADRNRLAFVRLDYQMADRRFYAKVQGSIFNGNFTVTADSVDPVAALRGACEKAMAVEGIA